MSDSKPEITFLTLTAAGFILVFALWFAESELMGFFLFLPLVLLSLLRWRFPKLRATVLVDGILCLLLTPTWGYAQYALILVMFQGMYRRFYPVVIAAVISVAVSFYDIGYFDLSFVLLLTLSALCGVFLSLWEQAQAQMFDLRDTEAGKYYELKEKQSSILTTLPQVERMAAISERTRIARDIHDNAGHEIVAAYISLQTARELLDEADADALELYDAALDRLKSGVNKIRETAHNLQSVTALGVEQLLEICEQFPVCPVSFKIYGDTSNIPFYIWSMLEACLNESLTNVMRHARARHVSVQLDVTQHIIRFCIENDGATGSDATLGIGLRNLRHRAISIGGTLSVGAGDVFSVICVIPFKEREDESANC